jgi:hypothetical protein
MNVYTTQLASAFLDGSGAGFGPWPGFRVVVVDVEWTVFAGDGSAFDLSDDGGNGRFAGGTWADDGTQDYRQWTGRAVLTDGGALVASGTFVGTLLVSGYLLSLP